jgi:hypothetical protein
VQEPVAWRLSNEAFDYQITSYDEEQANTYIKNGWHLIDALYTAPPTTQPTPVPKGWKLVPIQPTDRMLDDGLSEVDDLPDFYRVDAVAVYQAMLSAAPEKGQQ